MRFEGHRALAGDNIEKNNTLAHSGYAASLAPVAPSPPKGDRSEGFADTMVAGRA